eukprot:scaffold56135_cov28-Tisochrysis_lutea.AAC.4
MLAPAQASGSSMWVVLDGCVLSRSQLLVANRARAQTTPSASTSASGARDGTAVRSGSSASKPLSASHATGPASSGWKDAMRIKVRLHKSARAHSRAWSVARSACRIAANRSKKGRVYGPSRPGTACCRRCRAHLKSVCSIAGSGWACCTLGEWLV